MKMDERNISENVRFQLEGMKKSLTTQGLIPISIFSDPEIYETEMEQIFGRNWVYVAHESEIASPGDYVLRYIGEDKFIVAKDEKGNIQVLLDACPHRGASVCRAEKGNSSHYRCPYHGWTFNNSGELVGTPAFKDAYKGLDRGKNGLVKAPRVAVLHGLIFVSLEAEGPTLEESLDGMKWYLDMIFTLQDAGMEVLGEPQRWIIPANWKQPAENFTGDDYHLLYLHKSTYDIGVMPIPLIENMKGYHIKAGNGHNLSFSIDLDPNAPGPKYWNYPEEIVATFNLDNLSPKQQELARGSRVVVGTIFPNVSFLMLPLSADPKNLPPYPFMTWRQWQPKGPDKVEVWNWFMMYKDTPQEFKDACYRSAMATFGIAGVFEMDDAIPWETGARNAKGNFAKKHLNLNLQMGMEGMSNCSVVEDWPFPGTAYYPRFEEGNQRHFYHRYLKEMLNLQNYEIKW